MHLRESSIDKERFSNGTRDQDVRCRPESYAGGTGVPQDRAPQGAAEEIKEARSHGDLSENSEYDEAKNTQGLVENRITELEQMVKNAVIIE